MHAMTSSSPGHAAQPPVGLLRHVIFYKQAVICYHISGRWSRRGPTFLGRRKRSSWRPDRFASRGGQVRATQADTLSSRKMASGIKDLMPQSDVSANPLGVVNPVGPERTVERLIARELRESILSGRLKPGVRLPYRQLAQQFDVSVTPVRIALRELLTEGLVEMRPHGGASVAPLSLEELEELYSMRVGIEAWLSLLGAPKMSNEDLVLMRSQLRRLEEYARTRDRGPYLETALAFRSVCYTAAERPRLSTTTALLFKRTSRYMILSLTEEYRFDRSLVYMGQFAEHCEARDGRGAQATIREALEWSLEYVSQALTQLDGVSSAALV